MQAKNLYAPFNDAPEMEEIEAVINGWQRPRLPDRLEHLAQSSGEGSVVELAHLVREGLAEIDNADCKTGYFEIPIASWLYDFIRANVKRGRVFDLGAVLRRGSADCLGYAKLFTVLGRLFGFDVGVIEVVIDNAGRYVPHTAVMVRLSDGQLRFIDLWYGSKNISHKRVGLQAKQGGIWRIEDLELEELVSREQVCYLPDPYVDAITLYIQGNRYLSRQKFDTAIECYSKAIGLYPGNARFFYNRAITYENLGDCKRADADYAQALRDDAAIIRVMATEHDEVISLLDLDAREIDDLAQEMYLFYKGFATGREVPLAGVARKFGLSETEAGAILSSVEARLAAGSE